MVNQIDESRITKLATNFCSGTCAIKRFQRVKSAKNSSASFFPQETKEKQHFSEDLCRMMKQIYFNDYEITVVKK